MTSIHHLDKQCLYFIATAHSAGPGHGLCVADDTLQDDRNMLRQESLTLGGEHPGQCWGNLGASLYDFGASLVHLRQLLAMLGPSWG